MRDKTKAKKVTKEFSMGIGVYHCPNPNCNYGIGNDLMHIPVKKCPRCEQLLLWDLGKE